MKKSRIRHTRLCTFENLEARQVMANSLGVSEISALQACFAEENVTSLKGEDITILSSSPPVISTFGNNITFTEAESGGANAPAIKPYIANKATVSDSDSPNFAGGELRIHTNNPQSSDRFEFKSFQVFTVVGNELKYQGATFGTYTGGVGSTDLVVTFNGRATATKVGAALRNVQFNNISDTPNLTPRDIDITLTDGDGGTSDTYSKLVNIVAKNDTPTLTPATVNLDYAVNSAPVPLFPGVTVSDPDNNSYSQLAVAITNNVQNPNNRILLSGAFSFNGTQVLHNGLQIGTRNTNGGIGFNNLVITFTQSLEETTVNDLIAALRFRTLNGTDSRDRVVRLTVADPVASPNGKYGISDAFVNVTT
jgi:hypothetical protein